MSLRLQTALETLYGLERKRANLGLEGERVLLAALGDPQRRFRSVHVAGTNGKGSTCALIERVLRAAGIRAGLYTSPHLVDFRERIRVAGRWADEETLARRLDHLQSLPESHDRTFFEITTALAFDRFAEEGVEWGVIEVGLGGRLDSTNVIEPALTVITPIALDHTEILGDTIEKVAAEKAGIIKPGIPVVNGASQPEAEAVIDRVARERGAPEVRTFHRGTEAASAENRSVDRFGPLRDGNARVGWVAETVNWGRIELSTSLRAPYQGPNARNALEAIAALERQGLAIGAAAVREGFARARWPGRFEPCPTEPRLWWDGAHNPGGLAALADSWLEVLGEPPRATILGLSRDKDLGAALEIFARRFPGTRLIATRSRSERAADPESLARAAREVGLTAETLPDLGIAIPRALEVAGAGRVLLTGSLFLVGEAMEILGGAPGEML